MVAGWLCNILHYASGLFTCFGNENYNNLISVGILLTIVSSHCYLSFILFFLLVSFVLWHDYNYSSYMHIVGWRRARKYCIPFSWTLSRIAKGVRSLYIHSSFSSIEFDLIWFMSWLNKLLTAFAHVWLLK